MRLLATAAAAVSLAGPVPATSVQYVIGRQQPDGGFAEAGKSSTPRLTAWSILGLVAAGAQPTKALDAAAYLARQPASSALDLDLTTLALVALGHPVDALADRVDALRRGSGQIGPFVDSTAWGVLALKAAKRPIDRTTVSWLMGEQGSSGGWSSAITGSPDVDDTAVVIEALRAAGVSARGRAISRGLAYLERAHRPDGGYGEQPGEPSNAQTTAWVLQAFAAAGRIAEPAARRYLLRLRRHDGSFRNSPRDETTRLWVTATVLPALAGKPFPLLG